MGSAEQDQESVTDHELEARDEDHGAVSVTVGAGSEHDGADARADDALDDVSMAVQMPWGGTWSMVKAQARRELTPWNRVRVRMRTQTHARNWLQKAMGRPELMKHNGR